MLLVALENVITFILWALHVVSLLVFFWHLFSCVLNTCPWAGEQFW